MSNVGPKSFSSVRKARLALAQRADEILTGFLDTIREARAAGKYEEALKAQQWLIEHIPGDEEGQRMVEAGVDKPKPVTEGPKGPVVNIGFQLGGQAEPKALPEPVIDVQPISKPARKAKAKS